MGVKESWRRIEQWAKKSYPELLDDLRPGVTESEMRQLVVQFDVELPTDFLLSCRIHDGQFGDAAPLIEGMTMCSLRESLDEWTKWVEVLDSGTGDDEITDESNPPGAIKKLYANALWVPFATDYGGNNVAIDLDPAEKGIRGQIIDFGRGGYTKQVYGTSFAQFLEKLATDLETEDLIVIESEFGDPCFERKGKKGE